MSARSVAGIASALLLLGAGAATAGPFPRFQCEVREARKWEVPGLPQIDKTIADYWKGYLGTFFVDFEGLTLRFSEGALYTLHIQQAGGGSDWIAVAGQPGEGFASDPGTFIRIRTVADGKPIPSGGPMPFIMMHPFLRALVAGDCKAAPEN